MAPKSKLVAYHPVHGYAIEPTQDLKTIKRNQRERIRVETVNKTYETLRRVIPAAAVHKKMSKVNIIYHALEYINQLMYLIQSEQSQIMYQNIYHHQNMYSQRPASCSSVDSGISQSTFGPLNSCTFFPDPSSNYLATFSQEIFADSTPRQLVDSLNKNLVNHSTAEYTKQYSIEQSIQYRKQYSLEHDNQYRKQYSVQQSIQYNQHTTEDDVLDAIVDWQSS